MLGRYRRQNLASKTTITRTKRIPRNKDAERILISRCDLCNDELPKEADNIQYRINLLDEIDDSYESEYDKHEPRLLLCSSCKKEYMIPNYFIPVS
jgi:uncharacterized protein with PIN domain